MDKDEITKLPDGMSSEELDNFTTSEDEESEQTDENLAQEALDATATEEESSDDPAEESVTDETAAEETEETVSESDEKKAKVDPKDAVIGDFRRQVRERDIKLREQEIETARLQGELTARKSMQTEAEAPIKSPLDLAEEAWLKDPDNDGTLDDFAMTGKLYREQRVFDKAADSKTAEGKQTDTASIAMDKSVKALQADEFSSEKAGEGLDFKTVVALGQRYLDEADLLKIKITSDRDGVDAGVRKAYGLCKDAILAAGNEDSKLLQNAIDIKGKSKSQPKPKKKPTDIDALTTEGEDTNTGEAETGQSKRFTDFFAHITT